MPLSLQCPRCNGAVSVADEAAGKRVKCPHCEQTFLAPGIASTQNDDDDWLSLDEAPQAPASPKPAVDPSAVVGKKPRSPKQSPSTSPPASAPAAGGDKTQPSQPKPKTAAPALSSDEESLLAEFTNDLDAFTAEIESAPAPHPGATSEPLPAATPFRGRSPGKAHVPSASPPAGTGAAASPKPKPATDVVEYAKEYRVSCNICGSFLYAKAAQAGKTVKCGDCHSPITIPPPPKIKKKSQINLEQAETFGLEETRVADRGPDPFKQSASQLLEAASRQEEINPQQSYDDTPSVKEWAGNMFGIFKDLGVIVHWLALSVLACIPTLIVLNIDNPILYMGLFVGGFFLAVLTISCAFAILHTVANGEKTVSEWPILDPISWLGQLFVVVVAASVTAVPFWILCSVFVGPNLISTAITMFSIYIFFPFVLLSMLDMNTPFIPFSAEVARSITKCEEAWGGFYFSSGVLFLSLFMLFAVSMASGGYHFGAVISIVAAIAATFIYFSMIGRLAYAIGQAINAPPMKNVIDRSRPSDIA